MESVRSGPSAVLWHVGVLVQVPFVEKTIFFKKKKEKETILFPLKGLVSFSDINQPKIRAYLWTQQSYPRICPSSSCRPALS